MACVAVPARSVTGILTGLTGLVLAGVGLLAFNLGYVGLYGAFLPLVGLGTVLYVEVGEDFFLSLVLLVVTGTLLYAVGLFALPLIVGSVALTAPAVVLLRQWGLDLLPQTVRHDPRPGWRVLELQSVLLLALFARYVVYRSGGGRVPLEIADFESLARFVFSEIGGWGVFALGYGFQHRVRYGVLYTPGVDFASSLPALIATGVFLVSPYVAIMTLGLNTFGVAGLYIGTLPVGAAHVLMRTLTRRREEIERQSLRLQRLNLERARTERMAAIGQMSSTISHQILQKVGLLGLQCDLLRETVPEAVEAVEASARMQDMLHETRERIEQLDATITDLNTTLSDLLVFSRDFALQRHPCSLDLLLREVTTEVREAASARAVEIAYRCDGAPPTLPLDRIKLKQAVLNLITNALEASPSPGRIAVGLRQVGGRVQITVSDRGAGIGEAEMERLFAPFFSTKDTGTGLGLTYVQKIAELHHGTVTASNNPGGGATFVVELPIVSPGER